MMYLLVVAVLASVCRLNAGSVESANTQQELLAYQRKLNVMYNLLDAHCPQYAGKYDRSLPSEVSNAKELYNQVADKYIECQAKRLDDEQRTTAEYTTTTMATTSTGPPKVYKDCQEYYEDGVTKAGVYEIDPPNSTLPPFKVWCDFYLSQGWTVIQRRENRSLSFDRIWHAYKDGFGDIGGEYWLGNDRIHLLTQSNHNLNIQLKSRNGYQRGLWSKFYVSDESDKYRLTISSTDYIGDLDDILSTESNGMRFSTSHYDNDEKLGSSCADTHKGGWWHNKCRYQGYLNDDGNYPMYWGNLGTVSSSVMRVSRK